MKSVKEEKPREKKHPFFYTFGLGEEKESVIENLATLISSGMSIPETLNAIYAEVRSRRMKTIIREMKEEVEAGTPVWKALEESGMFSSQVIALARIGEESGRLAENIKLIAAEEAKQKNFIAKIRSAMMYPILVFSLTVVIGVSISWFILPRLASVFSQMNVELPTITRVIISLGRILGNYGYFIVPAVFVVLIALIYFLFFFGKTKFIGEFILLNLPGVKSLIREVEIARFGHFLGALLGAGLPVTKSLDSLVGSTTFVGYQKFYRFLKESVEDGNSFKKSFEKYPKAAALMTVPTLDLIAAGEKSGKLTEILLKIGDNFESKLDITAKDLTTVLEPILLVVVWLGVVAVALAIILPIYSLIGNFNAEPPAPPTPAQSAAVPAQTPTLTIIPTLTSSVNVRSAPSASGTVIGAAKAGDSYGYSGESSGWYEINFSGQNGWIFGKYAQVQK